MNLEIFTKEWYSTRKPSEIQAYRNWGAYFSCSFLTGFYQRPKSFWSCSHMNCCLQNIGVLLTNLPVLYIIHVKTS